MEGFVRSMLRLRLLSTRGRYIFRYSELSGVRRGFAKPLRILEAPNGLEPLHKGFADLSLSHLGTAPHHYQANRLIVGETVAFCKVLTGRIKSAVPEGREVERETGFEPATSTLARLHSTAELFPLDRVGY